jgi:hypothetical protein
MEKIFQKTCLVPALLAALLLLMLTQNAFAGAPEGHPESLDSSLRYILQQRLDGEGYMGDFRYGQDLARGISAYLWDNRQWLTSTDFHNARQVDVLVCLMIKKGYSEFDEYAADIKDWCNQTIKVPPSHH